MKWLARKNTGYKLALSFGICLLLAVGVGLIAIAQMARIQRSSDEIAIKRLPASATIAETLSNFKQLRILEWRRILTTDGTGQSQVDALMEAKIRDIRQNLNAYRDTTVRGDDRRDFENLCLRWEAYLGGHRTLMDLNRKGDLIKLSAFMQGRSNTDFNEAEAILDRMLAWNRENGKRLAEDATETYATARLMVLILLIVAAVVGAVMAYVVTQSIVPPLNQMEKVAGRLAVGDVSQQILIRSEDEVGRLAESLRAMLAYQKEMATVAEAIAGGDLTQTIVAKSEQDVLGNTFNRMVENLRHLVGALTTKGEALEQSETRYRSVVDNVKEVIFTADVKGNWTFLNPAWTLITGHSIEESLGQNLALFVIEEDQASNMAFFDMLRNREKDYCRHEIRCRGKENRICWLEVSMQSTFDSGRNLAGFFGILTDITERKQAEDQLQHLALHDALTGLPNRLLFGDRLKSAIARMKSHRSGVAVMFVDLDNFKVVNDSMGHAAGDTLLKTIACRLRASARAEDTIARMGGDEFTLLLEGLHSIDEAAHVADRIVAQLRNPILLGTCEVVASGSIGIAFSTDASSEADHLMRDADTAMYQAKANGKSGYVLFDPTMYDLALERMEIETGLRTAVERNELRLVYQPLVDLGTGKITGVEALVRWEHPKFGLLSPAKFIPVAEETGLIVPIGYWVMEEACRQLQTWKSDYSEFAAFTINVNLSGMQLLRADIADRVRTVLELTGLPASCLKLEITESVMMADVHEVVAKLTLLQALGVRLAMDDFGTGYSSMASLSLFPLDSIKIDRSFVARLSEQADARSVIAAIIMLSKALNLHTTGEGIETAEQLAYLQSLGCDIGQGYYFAKPLSAEAVEQAMVKGPASLLANKKPVGSSQTDKDMLTHILDAA